MFGKITARKGANEYSSGITALFLGVSHFCYLAMPLFIPGAAEGHSDVLRCQRCLSWSHSSSPYGLLAGESFVAKYCCDSSGAFVAEEILEVFKGLVLVLLVRVNHQLL